MRGERLWAAGFVCNYLRSKACSRGWGKGFCGQLRQIFVEMIFGEPSTPIIDFKPTQSRTCPATD